MSRRDPIAEATGLARAGRLAEAEAACRRAARTHARHAPLHALHGALLARLGRLADARRALEQAVRLDPRNRPALFDLAKLEIAEGRAEAALARFEQLAALEPRSDQALAGVAEALERLGRFDDAEARLAGAGGGESVLVAARLLARRGEHARAAERIEALLAATRPTDATRRRLLFALGAALERLDERDRAFDAYARANRIEAPSFDVALAARKFEETMRAFPAGRLAALPRAAARTGVPILVVGMPRSGSTLVERILAAHPAAAGAGETDALPRRVREASAACAEAPFPAFVERLAQRDVDRLGARYVEDLRATRRDATRIVDKNLHNLRLLGLAALLVPDARVVWCRRDPVATCFSCWTTPFPPHTLPFATDLETLGRYHRLCDLLMTHWIEVLDLPVLEVSYERLVDDFDAEARRLVDFAGLAWDDACARFHESAAPIATASWDQANRPIYRTSRDRGHAFGDRLEPLHRALGLAAPASAPAGSGNADERLGATDGAV